MTGAFGWDDLYLPGWEGVILAADLDILSPAELDTKLLDGGFEAVGTEESPFYHLTGENIQLLPDTALQQLYEDEKAVYQSLGYAVAGGAFTDTGITDTGTVSDGQSQLDWLVG